MQYAVRVGLSRDLPPATNLADTRSGEHVRFWLKAARQPAGIVVGRAPGLFHI